MKVIKAWFFSSLAWGLLAWVLWQRRRGHYRPELLRQAYLVWRWRGDCHTCLRWLMIRRDFGLPLPRRFVRLLESLLQAPELQTPEHQHSGVVWAQCFRPGGLPPVLSAGEQRAVRRLLWSPPNSLAEQEPAASLALDRRAAHEMQVLRRQFLARVKAEVQPSDATEARAPAGLCLVGNAGYLIGAGLGAGVDAHALVLRFNCWWRGPMELAQWSAADLGNKLHIWVCSPNPPEPPPIQPEWVLISGPDFGGDWQRWPVLKRLSEQGVKVLTVPLPVWRQAVRSLHAPPSAGLLVLSWLLSELSPSLSPSPLGPVKPLSQLALHIAGIGASPTLPGGRHHLLRRTAGGRHAWPAEAAMLAGWQEQGLQRLQAQTTLSAHFAPELSIARGSSACLLKALQSLLRWPSLFNPLKAVLLAMGLLVLELRAFRLPGQPWLSRQGFRLAGSIRDAMLNRVLAYRGVFEPNLSQFLREQIKLGDVCADIGANVGYFSLLLAQQVGAEGQVIAVEASPGNVRKLRRNVEVNHWNDRVRIEHAACTDQSGACHFYLHPRNDMHCRLQPPGAGELDAWLMGRKAWRQIEVPARRLDQLLGASAAQVRFLKLDIEGAEHLVVQHILQCCVHPDLCVALEVKTPHVRQTLEPFERAGFWLYDLHNDYSWLLDQCAAQRPQSLTYAQAYQTRYMRDLLVCRQALRLS